AMAESQSRNCCQIGVAEMIPRALVIAEKKEAIADNAPAESTTELVINHGRLGVGENLPCANRRVLMEFEQATVEIVIAGTQSYVDHGSAGASQFRIVVAGADIHAGNGLGGRNDAGQIARVYVVVDALNLITLGLAA